MQKFYLNKDKFVKGILEDRRKILNSNIVRLPNKELPFMEPHLRAIYFETYFLTAEGFYNASLVLCGILLENLVKEKLFMGGVPDEKLENMDFGQTIKKAKDMNLLTKEDLNFLGVKKDKLRNLYIHYNKMKISKGIYPPTCNVSSTKLFDLLKKVKEKKLTESQFRQELIKGEKMELKSSKEFKPLAQTTKAQIDEAIAIPTFLEIDKFTREFADKYFKPKNETETQKTR